MSEIKISLFKPTRKGEPGTKPIPTDFYSEMAKIKDGTHWPVINKLRSITDPVEKRTYKASKLEAFTISAFCPKYREIKGAVASGLLAIDLDPGKNKDITDWGAVRDLIFSMPEVVASFLSASGNGVAFVVKINPKKLKDVFYSIKDELADNFGLNLDAGCHDIVRLRFVSHDHDAKIREDFDAIPVKEPSFAYLENKRLKEAAVIEYTGEVGSANCDRAWNYAVKAAESKVGVFGDGSKHTYLVALAGFCNTVGMDLTYCESMVQKTYQHQTDISLERLLKPVRNVYKAYKHKFNTYVQTVKNRQISNKIVGELVNNHIRKGEKLTPEVLDAVAQKLELNIERVEEVAERVVDEYSEERNADAKKENAKFKQFWYIDEDEKVCINKYLFRDFLLSKGVFRFHIGKDWILIRIENSIVEEIQKDELKRIVMSYVEDMKEFEVWEVIANRVSSIFSDEYLELIPAKHIDFYRDNRKTISVFYRNGVVRVSDTSIDFIEWQEFEGYVWRSKVLDRDIELNTSPEPIKNDVITFLANISKNNEKRFQAIITSIGYLIHSFKDKANSPAIILNDEVISDEPEGGTGKGIIVDLIARFKKVDFIDGKLFDFADKFRYQTVDIDTDIIFFDDVEKGFKFQKLFSSLTTGLAVEKKSGLKFMIPFALSPKIVIATNYAIMGNGNSNERRKNELEIAQYYSKNKSPFDEFGRLLLDDFTPEEFNDFDNFILRCCMAYLVQGLVEQELINQPLKQLYAAVSHEFVDFMNEEYSFEVGKSQPYKIDQTEAYRKYQNLYPSKLGSKTFYSNMEKYYKYHEIPFKRTKIFDTRYFELGDV
jgi:hypothetical protein